MKNLFITIEGIDGCGKDTQILALSSLIRKKGELNIGNKYNNLWITREPTQMTTEGNKLFKIMNSKEKPDPSTILECYIEDRIIHTRTIKEVLKHSHIVCSRYDLSTFAYQATQGFSFEEMYNLHRYEKQNTLIPDITIVLDISAEISLKRAEQRPDEDGIKFFEKLDILKKIEAKQREAIKWWNNKDPSRKFAIIDASKTPNEVTNEIIEMLNSKF
ncbi:MAG TPA: dTMP kinase [Candidatus Dojkabacteria bacterium]|nr:dTMP kinase [Candidatus Dojkabacteria bacterium]